MILQLLIETSWGLAIAVELNLVMQPQPVYSHVQPAKSYICATRWHEVQSERQKRGRKFSGLSLSNSMFSSLQSIEPQSFRPKF